MNNIINNILGKTRGNNFANLYGFKNHKYKVYRSKIADEDELTQKTRELLAMSDKELAPDYQTNPTIVSEVKLKRKEKIKEYQKGVKDGTIKPLTQAEAIARNMNIKDLNEGIKESKRSYPSGWGRYIKEHPDKVPIMRQTILERKEPLPKPVFWHEDKNNPSLKTPTTPIIEKKKSLLDRLLWR